MKYFIDSAKLDEIRYAYENWGVDGVTTNPKHVQSSGKTASQAVEDIARWAQDNKLEDWRKFPISIETNPHEDNPDNLVRDGVALSKISANFVIKIACTEAGLIAARRLEQQGVRTNITLVFSAAQALMVGRIGALFVSPFIGWKERNGEESSVYFSTICKIYKNYNFSTEILAASVHTGKHLADAALYGADIATADLATFKNTFYHPFTDFGLKFFCDAWDGTAK